MRFDQELAQLADLLRVGAKTALTIAEERGRDEAVLLRLVKQAEAIATELDGLIQDGSRDDQGQAASLRLRRDR